MKRTVRPVDRIRNLGVPPNLDAINEDEVNELVQQDYDEAVDEFQHGEELDEGDEHQEVYLSEDVPKDEEGIRALEKEKSKWSYGKARWVGELHSYSIVSLYNAIELRWLILNCLFW